MKLSSLKRKLKTEKGFSLGEALVAILILLMATSIVAGGVPLAANAYHKIVDTSNAEVLLSTSMMNLRSNISVAGPESIETSGSAISYLDTSSWYRYEIKSVEGDGIKVTVKSGNVSATTPLVAIQDSMDGLYVYFDGVDYDNSNGIVTFNDMAVYKGPDAITSPSAFSIRVVAH